MVFFMHIYLPSELLINHCMCGDTAVRYLEFNKRFLVAFFFFS